VQPCPACGWQPPRRTRAVEVAPGDLGQVARDRTVTAWIADAAERATGMGCSSTSPTSAAMSPDGRPKVSREVRHMACLAVRRAY
jgi:hypothetical protein